ncbi:hypothetical protein ACWEKT_31515 [Nocardia takedensis]|uniref:hypothetical protein n=1 Tax=Nocardia takedensis TaxID=259390 RepID=UPI0002E1936C|nr:hypothetical protein [Nocardia takedensis]
MSTISTLGEIRPEHDRPVEAVLLRYQRSFRRPIREVWSACTRRGELARWLGTVTDTGGTLLLDLLDGPVVGPLAVRVAHCAAPGELVAHVDGSLVEMRMNQVGVVTTVELVRRHLSPEQAETLGPRWQYLLDRLEAYLDRRELPRWADYPELAGEYR